MSVDLYSGLAWLPRPPHDFSAKCRALREGDEHVGRHLRAMATCALDENQLARLAKVIELARQDGRSLAPLTPFRLGITSNATSHFIVPALIATAARYGIALECIEASFDQVVQEALSPDSTINTARVDAVLVALDYRGLPLSAAPGNADAAEATIVKCLQHLGAVRAGIRDNGNAISIVQTIARPPEAQFGSLDLALPGTLRSIVDTLNRRIAESVTGTSDLLLDVAGLAETVGLSDWHDPTAWNIGKLPFAGTFLPLYADHVCRLLAALRGKSRRCLILDLDNTVWSGVIGDDGLEGIVIGQGDPTGEAHLAVQSTALMLRGRGIVLAISSKNNEDAARLPFQKHPEMLLKENHIAVFQANWSDKATNIRAIANELSLGLDAMVFLDDSPVERGLVRDLLPDVAVPELPGDPAFYARTLLAAGYFEAVTLSREDLDRADFYQDNARRATLQIQASNIDDYLTSLDMVITFQPFDEMGRSRIAQLINKSNQFNLTTRRYTEGDVSIIERNPDCFTLQVRLSDSFGDNGMISAVICRPAGMDWELDTWLMSCRVLGRKVEIAVLQEIVANARRRGIRNLIGIYRPTGRNKLVEDHYPKLGFAFVEAEDDGSTIWNLAVAELPAENLPMAVKRLGFDLEPA